MKIWYRTEVGLYTFHFRMEILYIIKIKLRSFKSSEHIINETGWAILQSRLLKPLQ